MTDDERDTKRLMDIITALPDSKFGEWFSLSEINEKVRDLKSQRVSALLDQLGFDARKRSKTGAMIILSRNDVRIVAERFGLRLPIGVVTESSSAGERSSPGQEAANNSTSSSSESSSPTPNIVVKGSTNDFKGEDVEKLTLGSSGILFVLKNGQRVEYWTKRTPALVPSTGLPDFRSLMSMSLWQLGMNATFTGIEDEIKRAVVLEMLRSSRFPNEPSGIYCDTDFHHAFAQRRFRGMNLCWKCFDVRTGGLGRLAIEENYK